MRRPGGGAALLCIMLVAWSALIVTVLSAAIGMNKAMAAVAYQYTTA